MSSILTFRRIDGTLFILGTCNFDCRRVAYCGVMFCIWMVIVKAPTKDDSRSFVKLNLPSSLPQKQEKSVPQKEPVNLVISKNEPMSKYKDMEPDESVTVSFSDEEQ